MNKTLPQNWCIFVDGTEQFTPVMDYLKRQNSLADTNIDKCVNCYVGIHDGFTTFFYNKSTIRKFKLKLLTMKQFLAATQNTH